MENTEFLAYVLEKCPYLGVDGVHELYESMKKTRFFENLESNALCSAICDMMLEIVSQNENANIVNIEKNKNGTKFVLSDVGWMMVTKDGITSFKAKEGLDGHYSEIRAEDIVKGKNNQPEVRRRKISSYKKTDFYTYDVPKKSGKVTSDNSKDLVEKRSIVVFYDVLKNSKLDYAKLKNLEKNAEKITDVSLVDKIEKQYYSTAPKFVAYYGPENTQCGIERDNGSTIEMATSLMDPYMEDYWKSYQEQKNSKLFGNIDKLKNQQSRQLLDCLQAFVLKVKNKKTEADNESSVVVNDPAIDFLMKATDMRLQVLSQSMMSEDKQERVLLTRALEELVDEAGKRKQKTKVTHNEGVKLGDDVSMLFDSSRVKKSSRKKKENTDEKK